MWVFLRSNLALKANTSSAWPTFYKNAIVSAVWIKSGLLFLQDVISVGKIKQPRGKCTRDKVWIMTISCGVPAARHGIIRKSAGEMHYCTVQACSKELFLHIITGTSVKVPSRTLSTAAPVISHTRPAWIADAPSHTQLLTSESEADVISGVGFKYISTVRSQNNLPVDAPLRSSPHQCNHGS